MMIENKITILFQYIVQLFDHSFFFKSKPFPSAKMNSMGYKLYIICGKINYNNLKNI